MDDIRMLMDAGLEENDVVVLPIHASGMLSGKVFFKAVRATAYVSVEIKLLLLECLKGCGTRGLAEGCCQLSTSFRNFSLCSDIFCKVANLSKNVPILSENFPLPRMFVRL